MQYCEYTIICPQFATKRRRLDTAESRQHNSELRKLITSQAAETVQKMLIQSSHLAGHFQDALGRVSLSSEVLRDEILQELMRTKEELQRELKTDFWRNVNSSTLLTTPDLSNPERYARIRSRSKRNAPVRYTKAVVRWLPDDPSPDGSNPDSNQDEHLVQLLTADRIWKAGS